jgi:putative endonuclease
MQALSDILAQIPETAGIYVLCGRNGRYYTGAARNLHDRLSAHLSGKATRTKNQRPLYVVHVEQKPSFAEALQREKFLKSGAGRAWLKEQQTVSP